MGSDAEWYYDFFNALTEQERGALDIEKFNEITALRNSHTLMPFAAIERYRRSTE